MWKTEGSLSPALDVVERIARTEKVIAWIRAGVVAFNVATYLAFADTSDPRRDLALLVCVGAIVYTIAMLAWRPPADSSTLIAAITGTVVDTLLIGVWIYATGGFESPYFPVLYAEAAATVGRFGLTTGALLAVVSSGVYYVSASLGGVSVPGPEMSVRIAYIFAIVAFVGYVVDIARNSERYTAAAEAEAEALREVDRLRSMFVNHISHELRTPLTAVRGAAVTLNGKGAELKTEEADLLIEMIDRQSERLTALIEDIIDIGLIQEGQLSPRMTAIDLNSLVERITVSADAASAHPVVFKGSEGEARIVGDGPKIAGALKKVIDNAIKFSPPGEPVEVSIAITHSDYRIYVRDRGIGIAPENQARVFESFFQVDPTLSRAAPGTGIGLSIARAVMEIHGGGIDVKSEEQGTTFVLWVPKDPAGAFRASRPTPARRT